MPLLHLKVKKDNAINSTLPMTLQEQNKNVPMIHSQLSWFLFCFTYFIINLTCVVCVPHSLFPHLCIARLWRCSPGRTRAPTGSRTSQPGTSAECLEVSCQRNLQRKTPLESGLMQQELSAVERL